MQNDLKGLRYDIPEVEVLKRYISDYRNRAENHPQDKPFRMSTLEEYATKEVETSLGDLRVYMKSVGIDPSLRYNEQLEALEESDDPLAKFYLEINEIADEADSKVPYSYRLGGRLPGVAKVLSERIKQGQDPMTIAKRYIRVRMLKL